MTRKRSALPLFGNESAWVNVTVTCDDCGDSIVSIQMRELIDTQPEFECPICDKPIGQRTIVEASA